MHRAYQVGTTILGYALLVESGRGNEPCTTIGERPIVSLRRRLHSLLDQFEDHHLYKKAVKMSQDEVVTELKPHLQLAYRQAKQLYRAWQKLAGQSWEIEKTKAQRSIKTALFETICEAATNVGIPIRDGDREQLLKNFPLLVKKEGMSPVEAAINATAHLIGVKLDAVKEGAKERLQKQNLPKKPSKFPTSPTALDRLDEELHLRRTERSWARQAHRAPKRPSR
jgi:hypothetical protein